MNTNNSKKTEKSIAMLRKNLSRRKQQQEELEKLKSPSPLSDEEHQNHSESLKDS